MPVYSSLLSQVPIPQQQWKTQTSTPAIASIKVSDVDTSSSSKIGSNEKQSFLRIFTVSYWNNLIENFKQKLINKRIEKLESIPQDKLTAAQKAEIEANKLALNA